MYNSCFLVSMFPFNPAHSEKKLTRGKGKGAVNILRADSLSKEAYPRSSNVISFSPLVCFKDSVVPKQVVGECPVLKEHETEVDKILSKCLIEAKHYLKRKVCRTIQQHCECIHKNYSRPCLMTVICLKYF